MGKLFRSIESSLILTENTKTLTLSKLTLTTHTFNQKIERNIMKLITPDQEAKIRLRYEIITSCILATVIVGVAMYLTSPISYGLINGGVIA